MEDGISTILAAVIGGVIALISVVTTLIFNLWAQKAQFERQLTKDGKEARKSHCEELYVSFSKWATVAITSQMMLLSAMRNKVSYNDYQDDQIRQLSKLDVDHNRIELLIRAYFPKLYPVYADVLEALNQRNTIAAAYANAYKDRDEDVDLTDDFMKAQLALQNKAEELKSLIVTELIEQQTS